MIKKTYAFTIVELLVVMAVIAILVTMSVVAIQQIQKSTRSSKANNAAVQLKTQLEAYYNEFRQYPALSSDSTKTRIKYDTAKSAIYLCNATGLNCTSSTDPNVFSTVIVDQLGLAQVDMYSTDIVPVIGHTSEPICTSEVSDRTVFADKWKLYYSTDNANSLRPQHYYLSTCTEFGWKDFSEKTLEDNQVVITSNSSSSTAPSYSQPACQPCPPRSPCTCVPVTSGSSAF